MADKRGNPALSTRVSRGYNKRFDEVLVRLQTREAKALPADLVRIMLGDEKRFGLRPEERAYLAGQTDALSGHADAHDTGATPVRPRIRVRRID